MQRVQHTVRTGAIRAPKTTHVTTAHPQRSRRRENHACTYYQKGARQAEAQQALEAKVDSCSCTTLLCYRAAPAIVSFHGGSP